MLKQKICFSDCPQIFYSLFGSQWTLQKFISLLAKQSLVWKWPECTWVFYLSGSPHINSLLRSCMARLAFLYRNSSLLNFQSRKALCSSLIQPYIDYCSTSWYEGLSVSLKAKLDVLQRKMIRFIYQLDYRHHVGLPELQSLSWLSIPDRVKYFKLVHLFKIKHGLAPQYLRSNLNSVSDTHTHNTRGSCSNFHVSKTL